MWCGECLVFPMCKMKVNQYNIFIFLYKCPIASKYIGLTLKGAMKKRYHYTNEKGYTETRKLFELE